MKKLITITALVTTFAASSAFAKTEGNYLGVSALRVSADNKYKSNDTTASNYSNFKDSSMGYGVDYKYAFNFDKIFLAPGVFFDKLGVTAKDQDGDSVSANYRYGVKLDLGYDFNEKFSAYLSAGVANVNYKVDWKSISQKKSGSKTGFIGGIGLNYQALDNVVLNLEYNSQSLDFTTPDNGGINKVNSDIKALKFGVSYKF
jgi:opacity protein-like surface antigen